MNISTRLGTGDVIRTPVGEIEETRDEDKQHGISERIIFPCERSDAGEYGFCTYGRIGQSEEG